MTGSITFSEHTWDGKSSATHFAMDFIAERLPAGELRDTVRELADNNVLFLDLRGAESDLAVRILAQDLPEYIQGIDDASRRANLVAMFGDLCDYARQQLKYNAPEVP
ncbi:hypothetical protein [Mycolicibacterium tokaiense]|uniref:hypothetical protein n=1 Tax=Mycolicibacterium tokaiense TaxID=39695 RepID=UPI0011C0781E|nr:hypothetical protein [Mycolicibacterium tokaiense]BBY87759.1 hypothetical protein MTOK_35410 [Mycolicibacterium tokaiense]